MLQEPDCNLEMLGMWDNTPLLAACMYGHSEVALKLIERGADVFARNEHRATALHYSSVEGCLEVSKALLSKVEEGTAAWRKFTIATLIAMAKELHWLAAGATFEADDEGRTPLWLAARHGRVEVVQVLLKHGADASQQDQSGVSVLNANTGGGRCHEDLISLLLSANVDVNQTSGSPLCDAVKGNKKQVVEALLTHGASTNMPNASGTTALHAACERGDESLVQLLVRFRADPGAANAAGSTPQELLRRRGLADAWTGRPSRRDSVGTGSIWRSGGHYIVPQGVPARW
ncbi:Ankyrin repeat domain-containing protein 50 [Durusdinium trenchii]|uniref:Ankyrin repeat domain-containing protein 50 n=1 Tax=Durusdinium trenchii TaxID=1381693 RepID=A0ABP0I382_9DINO